MRLLLGPRMTRILYLARNATPTPGAGTCSPRPGITCARLARMLRDPQRRAHAAMRLTRKRLALSQ